MLALGLALTGTLLSPATAAPTGIDAVATATLLADGRVRASAQVRCPVGARVVELYAKVEQSSGATAQGIRYAPGITCDGAWHRSSAVVPAQQGRLRPGPATVDVLAYVRLPNGSQTAVRDTVAGRLVRPAR